MDNISQKNNGNIKNIWDCCVCPIYDESPDGVMVHGCRCHQETEIESQILRLITKFNLINLKMNY